VLASVGVVERQQPSVGPSGHDEHEMLDAENTAGNAIAVAATLGENLCTWWVGSIRARVMVMFTMECLRLVDEILL